MEKRDQNEKEVVVEVSDLALAAALCASDFILKGVSGNQRKVFLFVAKSEEGIRQKINDYHNRCLTVDARRYTEEMRMLKTLIFNE